MNAFSDVSLVGQMPNVSTKMGVMNVFAQKI